MTIERTFTAARSMFNDMRLARIIMPLAVVLLAFSAGAQTNRPASKEAVAEQKEAEVARLKE